MNSKKLQRLTTDLQEGVEEARKEIESAYKKMQKSKKREDIDSYRALQEEWLAIPQEIRDPPPPATDGDANVTIGGPSANGSDA
jgi:preprotein translocase subunit Sec63